MSSGSSLSPEVASLRRRWSPSLAGGLFWAWYAQRYGMGSLLRIGSGFLPIVLGLILAGLGAAIVVKGFIGTPEEVDPIEWQALAAVLLAVGGFALVVRTYGLVPATLVLTILSTLAHKAIKVRFGLMLGIILSGVAYLIFIVTLGLPMQAFTSRFYSLIGMG